MPRMYLDWSPVDEEILNQEGTDLRTAIAGRVPDDTPDLNRFLSRRGAGITGWRTILEGSMRGTGPRFINFAAPVAGGWMVASFQRQPGGGWGLVYTDPIQPHIE